MLRGKPWCAAAGPGARLSRQKEACDERSLFAAAAVGELDDILQYSEEPLVSSDVIRSSYSSVFDAGLTTVAGGTQVTVVAWYDNEWGYSSRVVDLIGFLAQKGL